MTAAPPAFRADLALFLDFDGTLAPLQDDPHTVALSDGMRAAVLAAATRLDGALAIVTGRDVRDLAARTPDALWRAGAHGSEVIAPGETPRPNAETAALAAEAETAFAELDGVWVEPKGPVVAVHFRQAPQREAEVLRELETIAARHPDYIVQRGKMVVEAKPRGANKGAAVEAFMQRSPFAGRTPVMIGDDTTDEDGFRAAARLGGWAVKVGDGPSDARYRLADVEAVRDWLEGANA